jgi:hypothetical protein
MSNFSAAPGEGQIQELTIFSNYFKDLNLAGNSFIELILYESILDYSVRASFSFVDTGYRSSGNSVAITEADGINLVSGEKVFLKVTDGYGQVISCKNDYQLRVNSLKSADETVNKTIISLDFYSKECIDNELVENRVTKRYEGKISDSVESILKNVLKTPKNLDIDPGLNDFNFLGHVEKPFYKIAWLAKRTVPDMPDSKGKLAGYFFFETLDDGVGSGGYKFKSIDMMWSQTPKRKLIYNDLVATPPGYNAKILSYSFNNSTSIDKLLKSGAFSSPTLKRFDPYTNEYVENQFSDTGRLKPKNMGGLEPPKIASDLDLWNKSSRISYRFDDKGVLPTGTTLKNQLEFSKDINFSTEEIIRQSYTRYNNLFTIKLSVTIVGDFGIHAGDLIRCDFPEISGKENTIVSSKKSGLYIVVDVAHRIHQTGYYTTLHLARESIYKK